MSARGPIVSPRHRALLITPTSPHMLFDRSLVLDGNETVRLEVIGEVAANLVVDGRSLGTLEPGMSVRCHAGAADARLVTFRRRDFFHILKTKFGLADR
jgi:NAD+ kinase